MTADLSTPEKAWEELVKALESGDEQAVRSVCTDNGFNSLFPADEMGGIILTPEDKIAQYKDFGKYLALNKPKWDDKGGNAKTASLEKNSSESMPPIELDFVEQDKSWKVDKYTELE